MDDEDQQGTYEEGLYTEAEIASFGITVELGAKNPDEQQFIDVGKSDRWERREPSGSGWVIKLLRNPVKILMQEGVPYVREDSKVTTVILHHERGLEKKIIRIAAVVERHSGDVALEIDKEIGD
jgi:hypothetical protein